MEWSIYLVIVELVTFLCLIVKPLLNLNSTITNLNNTVDNLAKEISDLSETNAKSHEQIWHKVNNHDSQIQEHETRIVLLEKGGKK